MANDYGYDDSFNPSSSFWSTPAQSSQNYYDMPKTDYSLTSGSTPNYFSDSSPNATYQPNYSLSSGNYSLGGGGDSPSYSSYEPSFQGDYSFQANNTPNYFANSTANPMSLPSPMSLGSIFQQPVGNAQAMSNDFVQRQPDQSSVGDYEVDPETGERRMTGGFMDSVRNFSMPQISQGQADLFKGLAGLYSSYKGREQAGQLRQAAQQQDPFGPQRAQYQQLLSQSYANPTAFTATPEARMQQDALKQQLERLDAKSGRRSQYGARAVQLAQAQAKQLADYRAGLQQAAGSNIGPQGAGDLYSKAATAEFNAAGAPLQSLGTIFERQVPGYQDQSARLKALEDAFAKKG